MSTIQISTLSNNVRVITEHLADSETASCGIWIDAGSRHETPPFTGAAHMVEHMLFKGTKTRNALDLAQVLEDVGGQMNAYTGREMTSYNARVLTADIPLAMDVLCDMVQNSTLPDDEIERERDVILQEIAMVADTPDDLIFDLYGEAAYPDQTFGAPILGTVQTIETMPKDALMNFIRSQYSGENLIVSAAGNLNHDEFTAMCEHLLSGLPAPTARDITPAQYKGTTENHVKPLEQSHLALGFKAPQRGAPDFHAAQILSLILGGGMSSRLFQEIREKRGLAYSVFSFHQGYSDNGHFVVYLGTDPARLEEATKVVCEELNAVAATISDEEIKKAKNQIKASLLMGRESTMRRADQNARHLLNYGEAFSIESRIAKIEAVDKTALASCARHIFSGTPTCISLGPKDITLDLGRYLQAA